VTLSLLLALGCTGSGELRDTSGGTATDTTEPTPGTTDTATDVEGVPGVDDPEDPVFQDDEVPVFTLSIPGDSWDELQEQTAFDQWYVEADLEVDGQVLESIGIRTKGENSWRPIADKASLKLQLDFLVSGQEFRGLKEITLQAMNEDRAMMHERVAYRLYREAGVPASRAQHAQVVINGESYGLYTNLETVDKRMMRQWFDDDDGPLWEVWDVDFYDDYVPDFQLEYGPDDRTRLQATADALELEPEPALDAVLASFDLDLFLRYWAVSGYVGQYDAYPFREPGDDCHVYDDPESGQLKFIPHGVDESWYDPGRVITDGVYGLVAEHCLEVPACMATFEQHVRDVLDIAEQIDLLGYFDTVQAQIAGLTVADDHKDYSDDEVATYQAAMREMIVERRAVLEGQLE